MHEVAEEAKERWVKPRAAYFSEIKQMVASPMRKPVLIVIAGPNGSGKTYTTRLVVKHGWAE
jgi:pantothenate kinase-related protein Tda10